MLRRQPRMLRGMVQHLQQRLPTSGAQHRSASIRRSWVLCERCSSSSLRLRERMMLRRLGACGG
jgi:hypothetical protein